MKLEHSSVEQPLEFRVVRLADLHIKLRRWTSEMANQRAHADARPDI